MKNRTNELVLSAIALVKAGEALESAKGKLRKLVDQRVAYESEEMKAALQDYLSLQQQWTKLETEHLKLRKRITES